MPLISTLATLLLGLAVVFWAPAAKAHCPHDNHPDPEHCPGEPPPPGATLGDLSCTTNQIAKFEGGNWVCADDEDTLADLPSCLDGDVAKFDGESEVWYCDSIAPPTVLQILDGNQNEVGTFLGFVSGGAVVTRPIEDNAGQIRNVLLLVGPGDEGQIGILVADGDIEATYLDSDCALHDQVFVDTGLLAGSGFTAGRNFDEFDRTWVVEDQSGFKLVLVSNGPEEIIDAPFYILKFGRCFQPPSSQASVSPAEVLDDDIEGTAPPPYTIQIPNSVQ